MPWSKTPKGFQSKTGGSTFGNQQALDNLRPATERTIRTTTITGGRKSDSDEENFLDTGLPEERWEGIRKGVTTTVTTEVAPEKTSKTSRGYTHGTSKSNKRRSFSLGQGSNSTLDDEDRRKPVGSFNPFQ
jgi:hypothetical protein